MDYEKAYNEALERAKSAIKECGDNKGRITMIESIFPELGENEDERIRKTLREIIIDYDPNNEILIKEVGVSQKQFITWLEKQGEQNSADSYCKDNCKGFQETGKCYADGECKAKRDAKQNPAWSEEDEKMMQCIHKYVKASASNFDYENIQIWFRNIKNRVQHHWKPTVDQMQSLYSVVITYSKKDDYKLTYDSLNSLYDDLKKL